MAPTTFAVTRLARPVPKAVAVLLVAAALLLASCSTQQWQAVSLVNRDRAAAGLPGLDIDMPLNQKAQAWANYLAEHKTLAHSDLADGPSAGWMRLGENVGYGPSIEAVQDAFMASPHHRDNVLDPAYNSVGTGVAYDENGTVYIVQVFAAY